MVRKFFGNLLLLLFANLLVKPLWVLGIDRAVQNTVGTETYGNYSTLLNFSLLLVILLDMGINNYSSKTVAQSQQLLHHNFSGIMLLKLMLSAVYIIACLLFGLISGFSTYEMYLLLWLCVNQALAFYILYLRSNISALQLFRTDTFLSVLDKLIMILLCGGLLLSSFRSYFRIEHFIYAQTFSYVISAAACLFFISPRLEKIKLSYDLSLLKNIVRQSWPYALLAFLMVSYTRVDFVMLNLMLPASDGDYQVGLYASAYRLLDAVNMMGVLVASLLLPIFLKMIKEKQPLEKLVRFSFPLVLIPALLLATYSFMYRSEIMQLLSNVQDDNIKAFPILMCCLIPICTIYVYGTLLTANGNLSFLNKVAFAGLLLNISLNIWLIPVFKCRGAAVATLVTQSFIALCHYIYAEKRMPLHNGLALFFKLFCMGILLGFLAFVSPGLHSLLRLSGPLLICLVLILILQIFDWKSGLATLKGFIKH